MFRIVVLSIFLVLFSLSVSAVSVSVNGTVGDTVSASVNLTNANDFALVGVKVTGDGVSMQPISIPAQSTVLANFSYTIGQSGSGTVNLGVDSFKNVSCSLMGAEVKTVNVTASGVSSVEVCVGGQVTFFNSYSNWVQFKIYPDTDLGSEVPSGQSYVRSFGAVGLFDVQIYPLNVFTGTSQVSVVDSNVMVAVSYSDPVVLYYSSSLRNGVLNIDSVNPSNFTVPYDSSQRGFVVLKNAASYALSGVTLSGDWLQFDSNGFGMAAGESRAVNFAVWPHVSDTAGTNQTYTFKLMASADGYYAVNASYTVFVPYSNVVVGNRSTPQWWYAKMEFCKQSPYNTDCFDQALFDQLNAGSQQSGICDSTITANVSKEAFEGYLRDSLQYGSDSKKAMDYVKMSDEQRKADDGMNFAIMNDTLNIAIRNSDNISELRSEVSVMFVSLFGFIAVACLGVGIFSFIKSKKRRDHNL